MSEHPESLQVIFEKYKEKYVYILKCLYPSKNSTGFPERNLSVNFSKAVEEFYPSACTWFEFQFGEKNNLHFDAVIIIPEIKSIYIIESKRFSNPTKKIEEIKKDMVRVNSVSTKYRGELAARIHNFSEHAVFGVILADVWTETKVKTKIKNAYLNCNFIDLFIPALNNAPFNNESYFVIGFEEATEYDWVNQNYYLLSMMWQVI